MISKDHKQKGSLIANPFETDHSIQDCKWENGLLLDKHSLLVQVGGQSWEMCSAKLKAVYFAFECNHLEKEQPG